MADESLDLLIRMVLDGKGARDAKTALDQVNAKTKENVTATKEVTKAEVAHQAALSSSVKNIAILSGMVAGPLVLAAKSYVSAMKYSETTSRSWLESTYQLERTYIRLGRVAAKAMLPWVQEASTLATQATAFAEQNPGVVKGALEIAGMGLATAGLVKFGGLLAGTVKSLGAFGGAVAVVTGLLVAFANSDFGKSVITTGLQGISIAGGFFGEIWAAILENRGVDKSKMDALILEIGKRLGVASDKGAPQKWGAGATDPEGGSTFVGTDVLKMLYERIKQEGYIEEDYNRQVMIRKRDLNIQMRYEDEDYNRSRMRGMRDFAIQIQFSEKMFYRQRAIASRDFNIQMVRNEQDYQRQRNRAQQDHEFDLFQIALSGDAMQYWLSERQFNIDKQRADEDFNIQKNRANQDFNRQMADSAEQFQIERAQQLRMFEISRSDQEIDFQIQRNRKLEQFLINQADIEFEYKKEYDRRKKAFAEQLLLLKSDEDQRKAYMTAISKQIWAEWNSMMNLQVNQFTNLFTQAVDRTNQLLAMLFSLAGGGNSNIIGGGAGAGFASGGKVGRTGLALVHAGEYVLTAGTTKAAENVAKTGLNQELLLRLMMGGSGQVTYNDQRQFDSRVSAEDRRAIQQDTVEVLRNLLS